MGRGGSHSIQGYGLHQFKDFRTVNNIIVEKCRSDIHSLCPAVTIAFGSRDVTRLLPFVLSQLSHWIAISLGQAKLYRSSVDGPTSSILSIGANHGGI